MVLETVQSLKNRIITGDTTEFIRAVSEIIGHRPFLYSS
ncbi:hypothetical protein COPEUT_01877 [Coprococcus eutactus ATCC 27759]|nr:hypothetical protein COPEUT_01877 [Coprococcus eutactus ATCC 27759]